MPLKPLLSLFCVLAVISMTGLIGLIGFVPPQSLPLLGWLAFYLFVFIACGASLTVVGTLVRIKLKEASVPIRQFATAFRQGLLISLVVVLALILSHEELLTAWTLLLAVLAVGLLELFFMTSRSRALARYE